MFDQIERKKRRASGGGGGGGGVGGVLILDRDPGDFDSAPRVESVARRYFRRKQAPRFEISNGSVH